MVTAKHPLPALPHFQKAKMGEEKFSPLSAEDKSFLEQRA
jgi:hypothetical protein